MSKPKIAEYDEAIATLDEMHASGEISDAEHEKRRAVLVKDRKALLPDGPPLPGWARALLALVVIVVGLAILIIAGRLLQGATLR